MRHTAAGTMALALALPATALALGPDDHGATGVARAGPTDAQVDPRHWSCRALARLARAGLVRSEPAYALEGARVYDRGELARLVAEAAASARASPEALEPRSRAELERLAAEYREELVREGLDARLPEEGGLADRAAGLAQGVEVNGSVVSRMEVVEGDGNDGLSTRLELETDLEGLRLGLTGNLEEEAPAGRRGEDLDLGGLWGLDVSTRYLEWERDATDEVRLLARGGDVLNLGYGQQLVVGALDLDGVQARARWREDHDVEGFWGVRAGGEELRGARAATRVAGTARAGLTAVTAEDPLGRWDGVGGADLDLEGERLRLRGEVARREAAGRGGFAALELRPDEHLRVEGQRRDYQGFVVDHNNAPIYTGVSGGEDRDERGSGLLVGLSPGEAVDLTARYDTTRRREQRPRRLSDAAYEATLYFSEGTDLTLGYEQEWSRLDVIRILNARTSHQTEAGRRLELDWNRDDDPAGLLETLRAELRLPLGSEGRYSLRLADTWRSSVEGQGHEPQVQTDWDLSEDASLSARYTAREGEPAEDRFTVTLVARF